MGPTVCARRRTTLSQQYVGRSLHQRIEHQLQRQLNLRHDMNPNRLQRCAQMRRGHLTTPALAELPKIESRLKLLIFGLHDLFYPLWDSEGMKCRAYNTQVIVELVQGVCEKACGVLSS